MRNRSVERFMPFGPAITQLVGSSAQDRLVFLFVER